MFLLNYRAKPGPEILNAWVSMVIAVRSLCAWVSFWRRMKQNRGWALTDTGQLLTEGGESLQYCILGSLLNMTRFFRMIQRDRVVK